MFNPREKTALFIEGANLYSTARALGVEIDYKRLRALFAKECALVRAYYYTAVADDQEYSSIRPLIDWLDYNGYRVVTKPTKEFYDAAGRRKIKGNMNVEICVDVLELADTLDHIVLFSGDGDFRALIAAAQRRGCKVTVVSSLRSSPPMIADELRRQADYFIDIGQLTDKVTRPLPERDPEDGDTARELRDD